MKKNLTYEIVKRKVFKEEKWMITLRRHKKRSIMLESNSAGTCTDV